MYREGENPHKFSICTFANQSLKSSQPDTYQTTQHPWNNLCVTRTSHPHYVCWSTLVFRRIQFRISFLYMQNITQGIIMYLSWFLFDACYVLHSICEMKEIEQHLQTIQWKGDISRILWKVDQSKMRDFAFEHFGLRTLKVRAIRIIAAWYLSSDWTVLPWLPNLCTRFPICKGRSRSAFNSA